MFGSELMAAAVDRQGVKTVFGLPGHLESFFGALQERDMRLINMRHEAAALIVERSIPAGTFHDAWYSETLDADARRVLGVEAPIADWFAEDGIAEPEIEARLIDAADRHMAEKAVRLGPDIMRMAEKNLLLQVLDQQWKEHLLTLDQLRQGITLRAYGQKDPLN